MAPGPAGMRSRSASMTEPPGVAAPAPPARVDALTFAAAGQGRDEGVRRLHRPVTSVAFAGTEATRASLARSARVRAISVPAPGHSSRRQAAAMSEQTYDEGRSRNLEALLR